MSGMPRPKVVPSLVDGPTLKPCCQLGSGNTRFPLESLTVLIPPPVIPPLWLFGGVPWFHVFSTKALAVVELVQLILEI